MCGWRKLPYFSSLVHLEIRSVFLSLGSGPVTCITNRIGHKSGCTSFWVQVLRNSSFYFLSSRTLGLREEADYLETIMLWRKLKMPQVLKSELYMEREREIYNGYRGARHELRSHLRSESCTITDERPNWILSKVLTQKIVNKISHFKPQGFGGFC